MALGMYTAGSSGAASVGAARPTRRPHGRFLRGAPIPSIVARAGPVGAFLRSSRPALGPRRLCLACRVRSGAPAPPPLRGPGPAPSALRRGRAAASPCPRFFARPLVRAFALRGLSLCRVFPAALPSVRCGLPVRSPLLPLGAALVSARPRGAAPCPLSGLRARRLRRGPRFGGCAAVFFRGGRSGCARLPPLAALRRGCCLVLRVLPAPLPSPPPRWGSGEARGLRPWGFAPPLWFALLAPLSRLPGRAARGPATDFFPVVSPKIVNRALTAERKRAILVVRGPFRSLFRGPREFYSVSVDGKKRRLVFDQAALFSCPLANAPAALSYLITGRHSA